MANLEHIRIGYFLAIVLAALTLGLAFWTPILATAAVAALFVLAAAWMLVDIRSRAFRTTGLHEGDLRQGDGNSALHWMPLPREPL